MNRHARLARPNGTAPAPAANGWAGAPYVALAMMMIIAVRLHEFIPGTSVLRPALVATLAGTGVILAFTSGRGRAAVFTHPVPLLVIGYWLVMIFSVPFALWPGLAFETVLAFLPCVALVLAVTMCPPNRRSALILQGGLAAAVAGYALYVVTLGRISGAGRLQAGVGMYDSNDMAALLAITFPLAVGLVRTQRGTLRWAMLGAATLVAAVVLASGSRGGILGLAAGSAVFVLGIRGSMRVVAIVAFFVTMAGLWTFSPSFKERVDSITNLEQYYNLTDEVGRKAVWARGRQYIADRPVIGLGAGNFPVAEGGYFAVTYFGTRGGKWSDAHNAYIQAYAELGVVGGSLFVAILLMGLLRALRLWRGVQVMGGGIAHQPELLASLMAYLVCAVFLSHAYFPPAFAIVALIAFIDNGIRPHLVKREGRTPHPPGVRQAALAASASRPPARI
jgi:O-antigen ligase